MLEFLKLVKSVLFYLVEDLFYFLFISSIFVFLSTKKKLGFLYFFKQKTLVKQYFLVIYAYLKETRQRVVSIAVAWIYRFFKYSAHEWVNEWGSAVLVTTSFCFALFAFFFIFVQDWVDYNFIGYEIEFLLTPSFFLIVPPFFFYLFIGFLFFWVKAMEIHFLLSWLVVVIFFFFFRFLYLFHAEVVRLVIRSWMNWTDQRDADEDFLTDEDPSVPETFEEVSISEAKREAWREVMGRRKKKPQPYNKEDSGIPDDWDYIEFEADRFDEPSDLKNIEYGQIIIFLLFWCWSFTVFCFVYCYIIMLWEGITRFSLGLNFRGKLLYYLWIWMWLFLIVFNILVVLTTALFLV